MIAYWLLFITASSLALISSNRIFTTANTAEFYRMNALWWVVIALLSVVIGLRHEVGGDWSGYLKIFTLIDSDEFSASSISVMMDPWIHHN